jgi:transposase IS204/IS1001/IS1096/IS1165 family protein
MVESSRKWFAEVCQKQLSGTDERTSTMYRDCLLNTLGINQAQVEKVVNKQGELRVVMRDPLEGCCPECGRRSRDRKTTRRRKLNGLGILGLRVTVILPVRVLYCRNEACARKTFVTSVAPELCGKGGLLPVACPLCQHA